MEAQNQQPAEDFPVRGGPPAADDTATNDSENIYGISGNIASSPITKVLYYLFYIYCLVSFEFGII